MARNLSQKVRDRARNICEYCHMPQECERAPFQLDHIIAEQHGGRSVLSNLALACLRCNKHKGPNIAGIDPVTGNLVPLFHPRRQQWQQHFRLAWALPCRTQPDRPRHDLCPGYKSSIRGCRAPGADGGEALPAGVELRVITSGRG